MKAIRQSTLGVTGLIAVVAVTIAVAVALPRLAPVPPATATPFSPPTLPASQTPGAYPGPRFTPPPAYQSIPSQTPASYPEAGPVYLPTGYPGPEATSPATEAVATASAPPPTPGPSLVVGPGTLRDSTGMFELELPAGWWGYSLSGMYLRNYDDNALEDVNRLPDGAIKVHIGLGQPDGRTVPEIMGAQQATDVSSSNAVEPGSGDRLTFSEVQPFQLGPYAACGYYLTTPDQRVERFIAFLEGERLIFISISPANSPAQDEAMAAALRILETLTFEPS